MLNLVVFIVVSAGILFVSRGGLRAGVAGLYQPAALELLLILALLQGPHWFEAPFSAPEAVSALLLALALLLGVAAWLGREPARGEADPSAGPAALEAASAGAVAVVAAGSPANEAGAAADPAPPGDAVADPPPLGDAVADPPASGDGAAVVEPGKAPTSAPVSTRGIYRAIRQPAYAAGLCFGWGALCQGLARVDATVFLGACLLTCASLLLIAAARAREADLYARWGTAYADYLKATKMFIPFLF